MKKTNNKKMFNRLLLAITFIMPTLFMPASEVEAAEFCSDQFYVDETLANGARWDMCWEHRDREGIIFHHVFYTPKDGTRRMVLNFAALAQIHVPYDDNGARFHDISDFGIGGNRLLALTTPECPDGTLIKFGSKNVMCKQTHEEQFAFKSGNNTAKSTGLSLFHVSPVGAYYYIPRWRFMDDGSIEPAIGATGALQRFGTNESRGWKMSNGRVGIAHLHNFYWKLDFDLNGTGNDDVVEEINFPLVNGKRQKQITSFNAEVSRKVNPSTMRQWRVRDKNTSNANGHNISYDILIKESGHQDIGPSSEPFTHNDIYVTKQKSNEKFGSHNVSGARNLAEFVNGENLVNDDIVVWPGVTFYHMPRNEDAPHMDAHWSHINIIPRDWHASNPLVTQPVNTPPTIANVSNQTTLQGTSVSLEINASDVDEDSLTYSASGLPTGLAINSNTGRISGTPTTAGNPTVTVSVSDGEESASTQFSWTVVAANNPPVITNPGSQSSNTGESVNLAIQATDSDAEDLTYSATGLPPGLQINSNTGVISGTTDTVSTNSVTVTASDAASSASTQFSWSVTAPVGVFSNEVADNAIAIDGTVSDWSTLNYYANDPDDVSGANNQIDWLRASVAHSSQNVFITYQNRQNIDSSNVTGSFVPWGWSIYLDTDNDASTGFDQGTIGAEFLISGNIVERYTGTGSNWSWAVVGDSTLNYSGDNLEMSFPRSFIANPDEMRIVFVGNNSVFGGSTRDIYPDTGSFRYQFTGDSNVNIAPVANNQQASVGSGASTSIVMTASDANNDSLTFSIVQQPQHGSITGSAPNIVYTADAAYVGVDTITFRANDGQVNSQTATITINVSSSENSGAFSNFVSSAIVIDGNNSEWAGLDRFDTDPNDAVGNIDWQDVAFAHNDQTMYLNYNNHGNVDPDSVSGSYLAWGWQVFIDTDKQTNTGYSVGALGADYMMEGDKLQKYTGTGSNWSWESIATAPTQFVGNIAELSVPRSLFGNPDSIRVVFAGDSRSYGLTGRDLYPNGQNDTSASRQYFDYDFSGGSTGGNTRPIATTQNVNVNTGNSVSITLSGSDSDNDTLTYNVVTSPANGSLSGTAPNLSYTPNAEFVGQDTFTFSVSDGTVNSETASVNINVTSVQNGIYSNLVNSINVDGNNADWSTLTSYPQDADDVSGTNNIINWQQATTAHNADTLYFMYQNHGAVDPSSTSGTHIGWGWQAFLDTDNNSSTGYQVGNIGADYIVEGTQLQRYTGTGTNWSWGDYTPVTLSYNANIVEYSFARSLITNPSEFKVLFVGASAVYGGNSVDSYPDNREAFTYRLSGGIVTTANRPEASDMTLAITHNSSRSFNLSASDLDNDSLTYRLVSGPSNGNISNFNATGNGITYSPNSNYSGSDTLRYVVNDGTFDSSVNTVTFNVAEDDNSNTGGSTGNSGSSESGGGSAPLFGMLLLAFIALLKSLLNSKTRVRSVKPI